MSVVLRLTIFPPDQGKRIQLQLVFVNKVSLEHSLLISLLFPMPALTHNSRIK